MRPSSSKLAAAGALALALAVPAAWVAAGALATSPGPPGWTEVRWPFPRDAWPPGRAFRCGDCGHDLVVYLRPKLGFCSNCATGVTDDVEVDGVTDLDLIAADFAPAGPGVPRRIGGLKGRSRQYAMTLADGRDAVAVGIAVSSGCDLVSATALSTLPMSDAEIETMAGFLGSAQPMAWLRQALDHP